MTVCAESLQRYQATKDPEAFRRLHDEFDNLIRRILSRYIHADDLDDCMQEFWMAVAEAKYEYDPSRPVQGWLISIAGRRAKKWLRRKQTAKRGGLERAKNAVAIVMDPTTVGDTQEIHEVARLIQAAINTLPDAEQHCVRDYYYHGYTLTEIAERRGMPLGTVKWCAKRAIQRLRQKLARHYRDGWPQHHHDGGLRRLSRALREIDDHPGIRRNWR